EFAGGPANGYRYLTDSNVDWGQDLKRLARYLQQHRADSPVKLAFLGSVLPSDYGIACEELPSGSEGFAPPARLTAGTYVISATQLCGVYDVRTRDAFWADPKIQASFRVVHEFLARPLSSDPDEPAMRAKVQ